MITTTSIGSHHAGFHANLTSDTTAYQCASSVVLLRCCTTCGVRFILNILFICCMQQYFVAVSSAIPVSYAIALTIENSKSSAHNYTRFKIDLHSVQDRQIFLLC